MSLKLSICVPSRNRQIYFQETIRALVKHKRSDVEFVFADNSDDPTIMNQFMERYRDDARIVFLPSQNHVLSMVDNWERTMEASTGDWISFIGDDDYLNPDVVDVLTRLVAIRPKLEAFDWVKLHFTWPEPGETLQGNLAVSFSHDVFEIHRGLTLNRAWLWQEADHTPVNGFSVYHAALSRKLMDAIKLRFGGRYFEHPVVDYDSSMKVSLVAQHCMATERSFSVLGACPLSNSGSLRSIETMIARNRDFMADLGRQLEDDPDMRDMPFRSTFGVAAAVLQVQHFIKQKYALVFKGWERNFTEAAARGCEKIASRPLFDLMVDGYRQAFRHWKNGRYLPYFKPEFKEPVASSGEAFSGVMNGKAYIGLKALDPRTPEQLYSAMNRVLSEPAEMTLSIKSLGKAG